ncbi:MAG: YfbK domain-containing protein [Flavisolibacter sp.]
MKYFINIVLFFFYPLLAFPQYFMKGQVKDEAGNALQNASIRLYSSRDTYFSRAEGLFGFNTKERFDSISVKLEGYIHQDMEVDATSFITIVLKKSAVYKSSRNNKLVSLTQDLKRETQHQWFTGDETYASLIENQFINATAYPATSVTLNVDRASYSNIRRFLTMNTPVPPDAVRLEEMLNYFNFNYKEPPGNSSFEIRTVLTDCPWNKENRLLFAHVNSKKLPLDNLPASHLVFLIDVSGSMDMPNRLPLLKNGFKALVNNLRAKDSVSIIVYGGMVGIALPTTGGDEKDRILKTIDSLQPGGSTPGESGIKLAYSVARNHYIKDGNNRIILATDGDFNVGIQKEEELEEMIATQKESGIYLTCLGIGMGNYKDSKIQSLAQRGTGNFAYIDNYAEAEKILLKEFTQTLFTVADDAFLNVEFNPEYIKEYRLLGFDNKVGAIKDKEAVIEGGEIGSAYSTLVAFEIIPTRPGLVASDAGHLFNPVNFILKYKNPQDNQGREVMESPSLTYTPFSKIDSCYRFATSVIMFGAMLRKSKFTKDLNWNDILESASESADPRSYSQQEFIKLIEQAKLVYGKKRKKGKRGD